MGTESKQKEVQLSFSEEVIQKVWEKGRIVSGNDPNVWRKDDCNAWMRRQDYGNRGSMYGWEIDHIKPVSEGGTDHIDNLRPLQWQNNAHKQDGKLGCAVTASDTENVPV